MKGLLGKILNGQILTASLIFIAGSSSIALAQSQFASTERSSAAVSHYARARSLMVEAVREFEEARTLARPDMFFNGDEWRTSVVSRAEDLNRVLDPKPRVTRSGVTFRANPALIRREREVRPLGDAGPQASSYEEKTPEPTAIAPTVRAMLEPAKRMQPEQIQPADTAEPEAAKKPDLFEPEMKDKERPADSAATLFQQEQQESQTKQEVLPAPSEQTSTVAPEQLPPAETTKSEEPVQTTVSPTAESPVAADNSTVPTAPAEPAVSDEDAMSQAIEQAIKERLKKISGKKPADETATEAKNN